MTSAQLIMDRHASWHGEIHGDRRNLIRDIQNRSNGLRYTYILLWHICREQHTQLLQENWAKTTSSRILVDSIIFLLSIADDRQKRYFLSMIETNYQKSPIRVSSIILKAHLWPLPSSRSVLLSFPQLGASIPHLKIKISDKSFENNPPYPAISE